jgi:hypothetical protein
MNDVLAHGLLAVGQLHPVLAHVEQNALENALAGNFGFDEVGIVTHFRLRK